MRKLFPIAGVIALSLTSASAFAADHPRGEQRGDRNAQTHQRDNDRAERRGFVPKQQNWQQNNQVRRNWQQGDRNRFQVERRGNDRRFEGWRNDNVRHSNFDRFRRNLQSQHRFRVAKYHAPRHHQYRRWSFGQRLPAAYWARNHWLANALVYGLFAPPPGLVWVRYGPDALLVDQYTGEIVQVRYGVFY